MADFLASNINIIAQIFGFGAMGVAILSYQFNKHKSIMLLMVLCTSLWCCHFLCLGLYTAFAINFINLIRSIVYTMRDKKWTQHIAVPISFLIVSLALTVLTYKDLTSILPFIASIFAIFGNWQTNTKRLRFLTLPVCICWFTYNMINGSIPGALNEAFTATSIIVAFIRYDVLKKEEKSKNA